jgi:hypothetical protein
LADIAFHNIRIYEARRYEKEDEETIAENEEIMVSWTAGFSYRAFDPFL